MKSNKRRIGIGLIGTGTIAEEHAMAIGQLASQCVLVAACDSNPARLLRFGEKFFFPNALTSAHELIAHPQVDVVTIATPPSTHEELVLAALAAGKYVVCEKPLAHNLTSAIKVAESKQADQKVSVSYQLRFHAEFERIRHFLSHPDIGRITRVSCRRVTPIEKSAVSKGWWGKWNVAGGGTVMTQFVHHLDFFCRLWGEPAWVEAEASSTTPGLESEDTCQMLIGFKNSVEAKCFCSIVGDSSANHLEIEGEFGLLSVPWARSVVKTTHQHILAEALTKSPIPQVRQVSLPMRIVRKVLRKLKLVNWTPPLPERSHTPYYREILSCIENGQPLPINPDESLASMKLVAGIYEAAATHKRVQFDSSSHN